MESIIILVSEILILFFIVLHCYYYRGKRITITFFLFAIFCMVWKVIGLPPPQGQADAHIHLRHYQLMFFPDDLLILSQSIVILGWVIVFYLSWSFSELIVHNIPHYRGKIFPVVLFSGLVAASFSYAIEATALNAGWWEWRYEFEEVAKSAFFAGGVPFYAITAWFDTTVHLLAAYFLIECSRFRSWRWKYIFLAIPYASFKFEYIGLRGQEQLGFILLGLIFAFKSSLHFQYERIARQITFSPAEEKKKFFFEKMAVLLPASGIIGYTMLVDIFKGGDFLLTISKLPLFFCFLLAVRRNIWMPVMLTPLMLALSFLHPYWFVVPVPLVAFLVFSGSSLWIQNSSRAK